MKLMSYLGKWGIVQLNCTKSLDPKLYGIINLQNTEADDEAESRRTVLGLVAALYRPFLEDMEQVAEELKLACIGKR
jgi:hypothetical protein